ncbi:MAG: phosphonoacetate hydrolase [Chloroflexi bacterium]|nr:phosphonoacetate hydrolase [Chloroflexota bacterium]
MVASITVNGRAYAWPRRPTVVVMIDGCDPAYLDDALDRRWMPRLAELLSDGWRQLGLAHMPTFTNPNNLSIVTGAPPAVHGIAGNHYLAPDGQEVQLVEPEQLRAPTIHAAFHQAGARVLAVTTKDKLRRLLAAGGTPAVSAERPSGVPAHGIADVTALVGRPAPGIYNWEISAYALEIGLAAHRQAGGLDLLYVSLTDYVQHKETPGGPLVERLYRRIDALVGDYLDAGFVVGITADHGMNAKQEDDGSPRVHYLAEVLAAAGVSGARVVLPITDPHVVHHGALGSFAWVHVAPEQRERARRALARLDGVEEVLTRAEAAVIYQHPPDRIGDLSVASDARTALGKARGDHDLTAVASGLRSHGGRHEQIVPLIASRPLSATWAARATRGVRNSDLHDVLLNGLG